MKEPLTSYTHALQLTLEAILPLDSELVCLSQLAGRVTAADIYARVDSPSLDASLKDGYAVRSADIACATSENPVRLHRAGFVSAGDKFEGEVRPGTAVRILSGAGIPAGADAVVSEEFTSEDGVSVIVMNHAEPGRNILRRGSDVGQGQRLIAAGTTLRPAQIGLLAAGGHHQAPVTRRPQVAVIATGDEVIAPGETLAAGKLFASNLVTLAAWCSWYGMGATTSVVKDEVTSLRDYLLRALATSDAILTSGGAWSGDRDLVIGVLDDLGWQKVYHRVRIGPGKAVGFGLWQGKPVFCLPGGPPSNQMAFLQLGLPGLMKLGGYRQPGLAEMVVKLGHSVSGQKDWTQFLEGSIQEMDTGIVFYPFKMRSRLQSMAETEGILELPEGVTSISAGATVRVQVLSLPGSRPTPDQ